MPYDDASNHAHISWLRYQIAHQLRQSIRSSYIYYFILYLSFQLSCCTPYKQHFTNNDLIRRRIVNYIPIRLASTTRTTRTNAKTNIIVQHLEKKYVCWCCLFNYAQSHNFTPPPKLATRSMIINKNVGIPHYSTFLLYCHYRLYIYSPPKPTSNFSTFTTTELGVDTRHHP